MPTTTQTRLQLEDRTITQVLADLTAAVREAVPAFAEEGERFTPAWHNSAGFGAHDLWPVSYRWIACYAIHGGSEGYYVHIDAIQPPPPRAGGIDPEKHRDVFLSFVKLWNKELAIEVASVCARLFIEAHS